MPDNTKRQGFTIVELLVVIVVIAILAVISVTAYNGIQNRAKNSLSVSDARELANKIELYNTIVGHYPVVDAKSQNFVDELATVLNSIEESKIDESLKDRIFSDAEFSAIGTPEQAIAFMRANSKITYENCSTPEVGGLVSYLQRENSGYSGFISIPLGDGDTTCLSP